MSAEVVIRGGTVYDGNGAPGRVADVAIAGGVIQEIGTGLSGARELDASGCAVTPGFIDIHTHYDAEVFWDPALRPSSYHGITTVVAGNCGFSIAPTRPEHRAVIVGTLENVEDMDPATLMAGIAWEFETFPDYLDAVARRGTVLNFTAYIGHSALRLYVMGDAAYERAATTDEIERMCALVREGIAAGAAGFSTSFSYAHRGVDGKPVPSRFSERDEVEALFLAAGEAGKGVVLITPGEQCTYEDVYEWQPRVGRPFTYPLFASPGGRHLKPVGLHEAGLRKGAQVWPQVTPRPLTMQFTMADPYSLNTGAVFGELMKVGRAVRLAAYRDPEWRALAAEDLEHSQMKPRWETFEVSESAKFPELEGRRVNDLARERDCSPLDVVCEIAVADDLTTRFRTYIANDEVDAVADLLTHESVALGLSDAGAHIDQLCDAPLPTDLLGTWVRDREVMPLERAVHKLTGEPAALFGFARRGALREGNWADVCVFDPTTVGTGPIRRVRDFPADAERLTAEEPTGVRHVLVNGTPIRADGAQIELTQPRPGMRPELAESAWDTTVTVIVVTGAATGMGRACVDLLQDRADHLVAVDLDAPAIDGTIGVACDVSDASRVERLADEIRRLGVFRGLVHAAGISPTMGDVRRVFAVDLLGTQFLLDAFAPLVEPGSAAVCFASSAAYQVTLLGPNPALDAFVDDPRVDGFLDAATERFDDSGLAYAWAKRGVIRAAARAAVAWGRRGGRVNSISPGLIATGMGMREFDAQPMMQVMLDHTPLGRLGRPDEAAALVAYLLSDAASFVSGIDVLMDGGMVEGLRGLAAGPTQ